MTLPDRTLRVAAHVPPVALAVRAAPRLTEPGGAPPRPAHVWLLGAAFTLPIWLTTFPPMTDFPQHLAMAAILRWFDDPVRGFADAYVVHLERPNTAFELLVALLSLVMPLPLAGKLVVAVAAAAVAPAAVALARRSGADPRLALLATCAAYDFALFWGFVGNVMAYPIVLFGLALSDRLLERPLSMRGVSCFAVLAAILYAVHLQFLAVFVIGTSVLALCRGEVRRGLAAAAACAPVLLAALVQVGQTAEHMGQSHRDLLEKANGLPGPGTKIAWWAWLTYGKHPGSAEGVLLALLVAVVAVTVSFRGTEPSAASGSDGSVPAAPDDRAWLLAARWTLLSATLAVIYFALPEGFVGHMVYERLPPLIVMMGAATLPATDGVRRGLATWLLALSVLVQLVSVGREMTWFEADARGLRTLIDRIPRGSNVAGLVFEPKSLAAPTAPVLVHFPVLAQALRGGRPLYSFAELDVAWTLARLRPGLPKDDLFEHMNEWHPERFSLARDGGRFRYYLVRGSEADMQHTFGSAPDMRWISAGRWYLVWQPRPGEPDPETLPPS